MRFACIDWSYLIPVIGRLLRPLESLAFKNRKFYHQFYLRPFSYLILAALRLVSMIVTDAPLKQPRSVMRIPFITPDEDEIFDEQ